MTAFVAFSGGKDSTALALRLGELGADFSLLFTPTGNELPDLREHIDRVVAMTGRSLVEPPNRSLDFWIRYHEALPNDRMRWCTRQIKIEPCLAFLRSQPGAVLYVGLRADEEERRGIYSATVDTQFPMREWGWGLAEVQKYLRQRGVSVPARTDCAVCYGQRIEEWWNLWRQHPEKFAEGEAYEALTGHTFRSSQRDSWPAALSALREEFESGRLPLSVQRAQRKADQRRALPMLPGFENDDDEDAPKSCRVCSL